jgi:hypothetical protein
MLLVRAIFVTACSQHLTACITGIPRATRVRLSRVYRAALGIRGTALSRRGTLVRGAGRSRNGIARRAVPVMAQRPDEAREVARGSRQAAGPSSAGDATRGRGAACRRRQPKPVARRWSARPDASAWGELAAPDAGGECRPLVTGDDQDRALPVLRVTQSDNAARQIYGGLVRRKLLLRQTGVAPRPTQLVTEGGTEPSLPRLTTSERSLQVGASTRTHLA